MTHDLELPSKAYFGGAWQSGSSRFTVTHPGTGEGIAEVADCTPEDARQAIDGAEAALRGWRKVNPYGRGEILRGWYELILRDEHALARLMALEMGKPITEARGEVQYAASFVEWNAEEARRIAGERVPMRFDHKRGIVSYEPVGIVYAVTPWNFPAAMITRKAGPALAAGCVMIVKPAEQSPMTALHLAKLWEEAGGPPGTLQVLPTSDAAALTAPFMEDARVRKLTFTGSTEVGRILYAQAAKTLKRVSLELGGHAPFLVFEDADIEKAAREVTLSKFRNAGQTCISTNRVIVQSAVVEAFTAELARATRALKVGDPLQEDTQVGPLVDADGLRKVQSQVDDALGRGARVVTGGRAGRGLFYEPTVLAGVRPGMRILQEETFGPIAAVVEFGEEEEGIRLANDSEYGLAAYAYTNDLRRAWRLSESLQYGIIGINDGIPTSMSPQAPFGGMKNSGVGREGGRWGLDEYLEVKFTSFGV